MEENVNMERQGKPEVALKELIFKVREWHAYLVSRWVLIVCFCVFGGLIGLAYSKFQKPLFTATTTFVLEESDSEGGLGKYAGLASMVGVDIGGQGGTIFQGDNILELYKSRAIIQKSLLKEVEYNGKKQLLIDRYIEFNKLRKRWEKYPALKNIQFKTTDTAKRTGFTRLQDSIIGTIIFDINKNYLIVEKPDKKLSFIKADVIAPDEFFAKLFNEQIVKNVNDFYVQTKTKKSLENITILQQKTDSVRSVMNGAIYAAARVADATPNLNITRQVQREAPVMRSQFSAESNKVILAELIKNLELAKISLKKDEPLIQVVDEPIFPLVVTKLSAIKGTFAGIVIAGFLIVSFLLLKKIISEVID